MRLPHVMRNFQLWPPRRPHVVLRVHAQHGRSSRLRNRCCLPLRRYLGTHASSPYAFDCLLYVLMHVFMVDPAAAAFVYRRTLQYHTYVHSSLLLAVCACALLCAMAAPSTAVGCTESPMDLPPGGVLRKLNLGEMLELQRLASAKVTSPRVREFLVGLAHVLALGDVAIPTTCVATLQGFCQPGIPQASVWTILGQPCLAVVRVDRRPRAALCIQPLQSIDGDQMARRSSSAADRVDSALWQCGAHCG